MKRSQKKVLPWNERVSLILYDRCSFWESVDHFQSSYILSSLR